MQITEINCADGTITVRDQTPDEAAASQAALAAWNAYIAANPPIDPITALANQIKADPNGLAAVKQVLGL